MQAKEKTHDQYFSNVTTHTSIFIITSKYIYKTKLVHFGILPIEKIWLEQGLYIYGQNINDCDDFLFEPICALPLCFDMSNMKKIVVQVFYDYFACNANAATNWLKQYINTRNL